MTREGPSRIDHLPQWVLALGSGVLFAFSSGCDSSGVAPIGASAARPGRATPVVEVDRDRADERRAEEPPVEYSNLQVLPDTITKDELLETMKLVTKSLGVKCNFCHRTDVRDYASDAIEKKIIAREMMRMVQMINDRLFTGDDAPEATCFMCHRGERKPRLRPTE